MAEERTPPAGYEQLPQELWPDDGKPPEVTPRLLKQLRGKYFTVKHAILEACGHRFDLINEPRNNCEICWINFFAYHSQLVETADQFYRTQGRNPMIAIRGKKFVRFFTRYMSSLYHEQQERKAKEDALQFQESSNSDIRAIEGTPSNG